MFKKVAIAAAIAAMSVGAQAQTTLANGDFAFTGINVNSTIGGWSFVTFKDISAGTTIYFTDTNVLQVAGTPGVFSTTAESFFKWTAATDIVAGTSVKTTGQGTGTPATFLATNGTVAGSGGTTNYNMSSGGDTFYAFQAASNATNYTAANITFLGAATSRAAATTADNPAVGAGLSGLQLLNFYTAGVTRYTEFNGQIAGTQYADIAALKTALADTSQWASLSASNGTVLSSAAMITPVPEASTFAMMLAGLGMMGFIARRRTRA